MNCYGEPAGTAGQPGNDVPGTTPGVTEYPAPRPSNIFWHAGNISGENRRQFFGQRPATVWLTGLSGAGKSTIAFELEKLLLHARRPCFVLDGDNLRHCLNRDLGFSAADRKENIRRTAEVARLMNDAGLIVITSFISPFREDREMARGIISQQRFVEVYVSTSVDVCESRDPKGLYARARAGHIRDFTGISSPYEPPVTPTLIVDTSALPVTHATNEVFDHLEKHFFD